MDDLSNSASVTLAIVVPTFNERDNVGVLVRLLDQALTGIRWEVMFVDDDSPDGTAEIVRSLAQSDRRVRCVQRIGRRGLSSACVEGILATAAPFVAVMDADLQHDETLLPKMLDELQQSDLDIVVGSRYVAGGSVGVWQDDRASMSRFATRLSRMVVRVALEDPMSGFFMVRRSSFMETAHQISAIGFKILLDLFASSPRPLKFRELPFQFRMRQAGESKLDSMVMWDYLMLLLDKSIGRYIPVRFLSFSIIGSVGVCLHLITLGIALKEIGLSFGWSQTIASVVAMTANFLLNNMLTYRDRRLRHWRLLTGLLSFYAACGLGAAANVGIAGVLFAHDYQWWLAGSCGIVVGAVWNYAVTAVFTWRRR